MRITTAEGVRGLIEREVTLSQKQEPVVNRA